MVNLVTVYHSGHGHTQRVAEAVSDGAKRAAGVNPTLITIGADGVVPSKDFDSLNAAGAIIFASPRERSGLFIALKYCILIARGFRNRLNHIPMLDHLAVLHSKNVDHRETSILGIGLAMIVHGHQVFRRNVSVTREHPVGKTIH